MGGVFHNQAGDLHTPGMGFHLGTPLSLSSPENHTNSVPAIDMHDFHPHLLHSQPFQSSNSFAQQQSYAPSSFVHRDSGYETMHHAHSGLPSEAMDETADPSNFTDFAARVYGNVSAPPTHSMEKSVTPPVSLPRSCVLIDILQISLSSYSECAHSDDQAFRRDSGDLPQQRPGLRSVNQRWYGSRSGGWSNQIPNCDSHLLRRRAAKTATFSLLAALERGTGFG